MSLFQTLKTYPEYRRYWLSQVISQTGYWMQGTTTGWLVLNLTGSAQSIGMVNFLHFLPALLLTLPSGTLADQFSRKAVMLWTQVMLLICSVALTLLTFAGVINYWQVLLITIISGTVSALGTPAKQAFGVDLVSKQHISTVSSLNSLYINLARLIGPALAGITIIYWGVSWNFFANTISYLPLILLLSTVSFAKDRVTAKSRGYQAFRDGLRYVLTDRLLLITGITLFWTATLGINMTSLLPAYARFVLKLTADQYGILFACVGLGACVGAFWRGIKGAGQLRAVQSASIGLAICYLLLSLPLIFPIACLIFALAGFLIATILIHSNTIFQHQAIDEMRGRVMATYSLIVLGSNPLGALLVGNLFEYCGGRVTVGLLGGLILLGTILSIFLYQYQSKKISQSSADAVRDIVSG